MNFLQMVAVVVESDRSLADEHVGGEIVVAAVVVVVVVVVVAAAVVVVVVVFAVVVVAAVVVVVVAAAAVVVVEAMSNDQVSCIFQVSTIVFRQTSPTCLQTRYHHHQQARVSSFEAPQ